MDIRSDNIYSISPRRNPNEYIEAAAITRFLISLPRNEITRNFFHPSFIAPAIAPARSNIGLGVAASINIAGVPQRLTIIRSFSTRPCLGSNGDAVRPR